MTPVGRGGNVVIPTFAVERAQELMYYISELVRGRHIPDLQVSSPKFTASAGPRVPTNGGADVGELPWVGVRRRMSISRTIDPLDLNP